MDTLGDTIDRRTALPADSLCEAALAAFIHDLDCRALAIVDGERPIGIVHREAFLARMERAGAADRPILETAEPDPLIVEADEPIGAFVERMMAQRPAALLDGFIVCRGGAYLGVCDLALLLPALTAPRQDAGLIERICTEVREPVAHALAAADGLGRLRLPEGAAPAPRDHHRGRPHHAFPARHRRGAAAGRRRTSGDLRRAAPPAGG
ncbi:MAG: hypothetical protein WDM85_05460 [Caulobacteraceae bacterium]